VRPEGAIIGTEKGRRHRTGRFNPSRRFVHRNDAAHHVYPEREAKVTGDWTGYKTVIDVVIDW
jgi:hypothetical protein